MALLIFFYSHLWFYTRALVALTTRVCSTAYLSIPRYLVPRINALDMDLLFIFRIAVAAFHFIVNSELV